MTYNSKIHFYNINGAKLSQPQQMTVGDVHDMFVPLADGLLTSIEESEAVIDILMEQIPQMFSDTRETETVLGPVIQAGKEAFKVILDMIPNTLDSTDIFYEHESLCYFKYCLIFSRPLNVLENLLYFIIICQ